MSQQCSPRDSALSVLPLFLASENHLLMMSEAYLWVHCVPLWYASINSSFGSLRPGSLLISGQVARFQTPSNTLRATPVRITFPVPVSDAQYLTDACSELVLILHAAAIDTYIYYYVLQNVFPTGPVSEAPEYTSVCVLELHFWYLKFARKVLCCDTYLVCFQSLHSKTSLMSAHTTIFHPHSVQFGGWSSQGLRLSGSWENGSTHVVCESTHLTSFAMLVDYSGVVAVSLSPCTASFHAFPPVSHHFDPSIPSTFFPSFITHYHLSPPFLHPSICPFLPPSLPPSFLLAIPPLFPPPYPPVNVYAMQEEENETDLFSILTYVGCGISILCLLGSIFFFLSLK